MLNGDAAPMADTSTDASPLEGEDTKQPLNLEVKIDSPGACKRHIVVTVSREDVDRYLDDAVKDLAPKAEVPGFRAGRAPKKLVESRFKKELSNQVKGALLMDSMEQVSDSQEFSAISEPEFDIESVEIPDEGPFTFEFEVEVRPEFDLPDWKGLKLQRHVRDFSEEEVDQHLKRVLGRYSTVVASTTPVETDSVIVANLVFEHDGVEIARLNGQTIDVKPIVSLHDGEINGFLEAVQGGQAGEIRRAKATISPSCADPELANETVDVEIEIVAVKKREYPVLSTAMLEKLGGFESEQQLRDVIRNELTRQLSYHQSREVRQQITSLLTAAATWDLPTDMLKRQFRRELERAVMELQSSGFSDQEIRTKEAMIRQNSLESTSVAMKEHFILERIAEEESIEADEQDFNALIQTIALRENESVRRIRARLEKRGQMDSLRNQIIEQKVIDLIVSNADVTETPFVPQPENTTTIAANIIDRAEGDIPEAKHGGEEALRTPADRS